MGRGAEEGARNRVLEQIEYDLAPVVLLQTWHRERCPLGLEEGLKDQSDSNLACFVRQTDIRTKVQISLS